MPNCLQAIQLDRSCILLCIIIVRYFSERHFLANSDLPTRPDASSAYRRLRQMD